MKITKKILGFLAFFLALALVSANSYQVEFTQVGDKIVVKEFRDNVKINSYVSSDILEKSSKRYYFVKKIVFNESFSKAEIRLILDEGIVIENEEIYPAEYNLDTNGRTINILWELENVQKNQVFAMFLKLEDTKMEFSKLYWIIGLIVVIFLGYSIFKRIKTSKKIESKPRSSAKTKETSGNEKKYDYLLDTENLVIDELKKADRNELWQKQIQNSTGFSKAKVSRLVRNLESRNLVSKIPFGNTNKIRLK